MENEFINFQEGELLGVAKSILDLLTSPKIILLEGQMGAGKTNLVRHLAQWLGADQEVSSPSFSVINEYRCKENPWGILQFIHMDLYRLKNLEEAHQAGVFEYLNGDHTVLIEWPEMLLPLLSELPIMRIQFEVLDNQARSLKLTF